MLCRKCKREIPSDGKFCPYCGAQQVCWVVGVEDMGILLWQDTHIFGFCQQDML